MDLLSNIFHNYYQAKIVEILLENHDEEFSISEIMRMAETAQGSTYKYMKFLNKEGLINKTRKIGNVQLYRLNKKNDYIKAFILFEHYLVTTKLDRKIIEKDRIKQNIKTINEKEMKIIEHFMGNRYYEKYDVEQDFSEEEIFESYSLKEEDTEEWKKIVKK